MKLVHDFVQFIFLLLQQQDLCFKATGRGNASQFQRALELLQNVAFPCFIGMQFQAERAQTDLRQALLNDGKRGHFIRDKQHAFPLIQRVRNNIRNGLGFTGSGRSVKDKTAAARGRNDRCQL